ncbi:MAG: PspA/IM30 family protein [Defluviitaleaceae bacterium]|nr:PspA/IM30 family protein [Defluviitaleaceae bacterium]MCL2275715.1 PspA/IM30 family protein [Defluviitaleaceae bacterium]
MGVLSRFKNIMAANVNALLDKVEDPAKMIDQTLRQLATDLAAVKKETAGVMAEETRTRREADANQEQVKKNMDLAKKALQAGNEDHARVFLNKKNELEAQGVELQKLAEAAQQNAVQMRQMHDKLVRDINQLRSRQATIKSNLAVAKATERVNKVGAAGSKAEGAMQAFSRFEAQAQERLDRARALGALNEVPKDEAAALADLYKSGGGAALDDELAALKVEMGLAPATSTDDDLAALYAELDNDAPIPN